MKYLGGEKSNILFFSARDGSYNAALPFISGSLIQLFLASKGISSNKIGIVMMLVHAISIGTTLLLSDLAERCESPLQKSNMIALLHVLLFPVAFLCLLPGLSEKFVYWLMLLTTCIQVFLNVCWTIYGHKVPYQIISIQNYGLLLAISGIVAGLISVGTSWLSALFLALYLIAYAGKIIVDYAVPVVVMQMVDPAIAGTYNAWRTLLASISAAVTSYVYGVLLGKVHFLWLLLPCACSYLACLIWYAVFDKGSKYKV